MKAELLILGSLHRGPLHPYEIKRRLTNALVECYTDVDVGTLYYAIRQLDKAGHIESLGSERVVRGGQRTVYGITASGKSRFQELLLEHFRDEGSGARSLYPALLFLHLAELPAVAGLLRQRLEQTEAALQELRKIKQEIGVLVGTGVRYLMEHLTEVRRLDRRWMRRLLADVEAAKVRDASPSLAKRFGIKTSHKGK
jgi:DNA-binding PadR family transcriptional regulator